MAGSIRVMAFCVVIAVGCTLLTVISCGEKAVDGETSYSVSGIITDSLNQMPLDSVAICIGDSLVTLTYSDTSGYYRFGMFAGTFTFYAVKSGYSTQSRTVNLKGDLTGIGFRLVEQEQASERG